MPTPARSALRLLLVLGVACATGCGGEHLGPGEVSEVRVPGEVRTRRAEASALPAAAAKQILFGDLHVHTTFSPDALALSLPAMGGEGAHPPADACDFARFCAGLDFWSINDHAEGITPQRWQETRDSIRQCNAVSGDPAAPDMVSYLGWEWSQVSLQPESHYGHKNVIFRETADEQVPVRPIAAPREQFGDAPIPRSAQLLLAVLDPANRGLYLSFQRYYDEIGATPHCESGVDTRELPADCHETAADPATLFRKLDEWDHESIVIPHGNAWGLNTPPGTSFDKQLTREQHDPDRQILFEVYSGHGNSEEYRDWRAVDFAGSGRQCPEAREGYTPCCRRAGEIIRERCEAAGEGGCDAREDEAQQNYVDAGVTGYWTVPGTRVEDWLDCGQCTDCFNPAMDHRPATTAQYALVLTDPANPDGAGGRFRFGLIGSSDNHTARPGTGYKEFARFGMTEASGPQNERMAARTFSDPRDPEPRSVRYDHAAAPLGLSKLRHMERQTSFWMTGGLVAVHSEGRDRNTVWNAMQRREVYATSGDRILLWFDLLGPGGKVAAAMGSEATVATAPRFRVRAVGALEQLPGCPAEISRAVGADEIARLCLGECYHPGDARRPLTRIEVVRIRPQQSPDEDVASLIEDPWRVFPCTSPDCSAEFEDPGFGSAGRETLYYVRAIQEATPAVNADGLRCRRDPEGRCLEVDPCYGDPRTPKDDDCLAPNEERAWSSPIYLRPAG